MSKQEKTPNEESLAAFSEKYQAGLQGFVASFFKEPSDEGVIMMPPDPFTMGTGDDGRTFEELSSEEIEIVRTTLYKVLGIDKKDPDAVNRTYMSSAPEDATVPGKIAISVFNTNISGVFLHELVFPDRVVRFALGPNSNL